MVLYVNHKDDIDPFSMTEHYKDTITGHLQNWVNNHGLCGWFVTGEFEDEG